MQLPVPFNQLITQPMAFPLGEPPVVPNINVHPEVMGLIPYAASLAINEVNRLATTNSPIRIFCFNLLVSNNYHNEFVGALTCFLLDHALLNSRKSGSSNIQYLLQTGYQASINLWTSSLIEKFPAIQNYLDHGQLASLRQTLASFHMVVNEFNQLYNGVNQGFSSGSGMPMGGGVTYAGGGGGVPTYTGGMPMQQNRTSMGISTGSSWTDRPANAGVNFSEVGLNASRFNDRFAEMSKNNKLPTQEPSREERSYQQVEVPVNTQEVNDDEIKTLTVNGGSEVNRSKHAIQLFDTKYSYDTKSNYSDVRQASDELVLLDDVFESDVVYIKNEVIDADSLSEVIATLKMDLVDDSVNNKILRGFGIITNPYFVRFNPDDYLKRILSSTDIKNLIAKMKSVGEALASQDNTDPYVRQVATWLSSLNNHLTEKLNYFLTHNLMLEVEVESFTEDYSDLGPYLTENYGERYEQYLTRFESYIMYSFLGKERVLSKRNDLEDSYSSEGLGYLIPYSTDISVTIIEQTYTELGYCMEKNVIYAVDSEASHVLYNVADTIQRDSEAIHLNTFKNYCLTSDGVLLELFLDLIRDKWMVIRRGFSVE